MDINQLERWAYDTEYYQIERFFDEHVLYGTYELGKEFFTFVFDRQAHSTFFYALQKQYPFQQLLETYNETSFINHWSQNEFFVSISLPHLSHFNFFDDEGFAVLNTIITRGSDSLFYLCLNYSVDVNIQDKRKDKRTPLYYAFDAFLDAHTHSLLQKGARFDFEINNQPFLAAYEKQNSKENFRRFISFLDTKFDSLTEKEQQLLKPYRLKYLF